MPFCTVVSVAFLLVTTKCAIRFCVHLNALTLNNFCPILYPPPPLKLEVDSFSVNAPESYGESRRLSLADDPDDDVVRETIR